MSLAAALRDARQTRRVAHAQAQVVKRYWKAVGDPAAPRGLRLRFPIRSAPFFLIPLAPLLVPLFAWLGTRDAGGLPLEFLTCILVFAFGGHRFQSNALAFAANDVLRHPSKAGVLLLRLWGHRMALLWTGACWALAHAIVLGEAIRQEPVHCALLLLAIVLSPLAWTSGKLLCRLIGDETSILGPLVLPALAATSLIGLRAPSAGVVEIALSVLLTGLGVYALFRVGRDWIRQPHLHQRAFGAELATVPRGLVGVGLVLPSSVVRDPAVLAWVAWCALAFVAIITFYALNRLFLAVRHAEERTSGSAIQTVDPSEPPDDPRRAPVPAVLPDTHAGRRSLTRAALYLHRRNSWFRPGEITTPLQFLRSLPQILPMTIYHGWGALLGALAVWRTTESKLQVTIALLAGATAPAFVAKELSFDLHRLGVDYTEQARHNLRSLVLFAVLPTVLAAGIAGCVAGWNAQRALVLAVIGAVFALRAGWRGFLGGDADDFDPRIVLAAIVLLAASLWLPLATWWSAGAALAIGLVGVFLRVRRWDERGLAEAVRKREECRG